MTNKVKVKTPHGVFVVYNFKERFGNKYISEDEFDPDQIIFNSGSLLFMSTNKNKGSPAGTFEVRLAATKNWTSVITPGSWCLILMSNNKLDNTAKYGDPKQPGGVSDKSFKMIGRIESVRGISSVNSTDGSMYKYYVVTGSDWGTVFNSSIYLDPLNRDIFNTAFGMATRTSWVDFKDKGNIHKSTQTNNKKEPTSTDKQTNQAINDMSAMSSKTKDSAKNEKATIDEKKETSLDVESAVPEENGTEVHNVISFLISLWRSGGDNKAAENANQITQVTQGKRLGLSQLDLRLPEVLKNYLGLSDSGPTGFVDVTSGTGKLIAYDKYSGKDNTISLLGFNNILGEHSMWEVLMANMNRLASELIPEVRFESENKASLTLYNRHKPFVIDKKRLYSDTVFVGDGVSSENCSAFIDDYISEFKNVRCIDIDYNDVLFSSCGTNWRDKINFVDVSLNRSYDPLKGSLSNAQALESRFYDPKSISRDGLRSRRETITWWVKTNQQQDVPLAINSFKYLMKEWYFHVHTTLNGSLHLVGQDRYIQVGDNIRVDPKVLDINKNFSQPQNIRKEPTYFLAHVESISHNMSYEGDHRSFTTNITFSRGIFVDEKMNQIDVDVSGAIDQDATKLGPAQETNSRASFSSSTTDPDKQKLGGNK